MCEKRLFNRLIQNQSELSRLNAQYYLVKDKIELKLKLLDTRVITGDVYIDRARNLSGEYYEMTEERVDKVAIRKRTPSAGVDFEQLLRDRKPQGLNTGFKPPPSEGGQPKEGGAL
jgi:hypothetical protein